MACIVTVNEPGVLPAALQVRGMVFSHGLPVQAVLSNFLRQYPFSPSLIYCGVKQRKRINGISLHPPTVDLHLADIEGFSGCESFPDYSFRLFPCGRVVGLASHIDGQGIQPGFLPGDGLDQGGRRFLPFRAIERDEQGNGQYYSNHSFHRVHSPRFALSPKSE